MPLKGNSDIVEGWWQKFVILVLIVTVNYYIPSTLLTLAQYMNRAGIEILFSVTVQQHFVLWKQAVFFTWDMKHQPPHTLPVLVYWLDATWTIVSQNDMMSKPRPGWLSSINKTSPVHVLCLSLSPINTEPRSMRTGQWNSTGAWPLKCFRLGCRIPMIHD